MIRALKIAALGWLIVLAVPTVAHSAEVRLKDLGHFLGWRDNALVGYGIVTGLAGSGDSPRSAATRQALSNVLSRLGANIPGELLQSRNVAVVIVTATLPPSANVGDRIDVTATSIGDARSLAGGMLLMTPLLGPDQRTYALAQGALVVGGYSFQDSVNVRQKNYPTTGIVAGGATVETAVAANLVGADGHLTFVLRDPDFTTAHRIADRLNHALGSQRATVQSANAVVIDAAGEGGGSTARLLASIEGISIQPDQAARVVINERSGTVVSGGDVRISSVVVAQGDIKVSVSVDRRASPYIYGTPEARVVAPTTRLDVTDAASDSVVRVPDTTVAGLVRALARAKVSTRNTIAILQAVKAAGALHAVIIVQ